MTYWGYINQLGLSWRLHQGAPGGAMSDHRPIDRACVAAQANAGPLADNGQAVGRRCNSRQWPNPWFCCDVNRGGGGELLTLPLLPSELHQLTPSSGGPDDTDGGIQNQTVEPIHQDQRRLTGQRVRAAEAISQDVRAAVIDEVHLAHIQQSDLAFGCC